VATECSRNGGSKTQYYVVILDRLQGHSGALERAPELWIRGPLTGTQLCVGEKSTLLGVDSSTKAKTS